MSKAKLSYLHIVASKSSLCTYEVWDTLWPRVQSQGVPGDASLKLSDGNVQYGKGTASELSHTEGLHLSGAAQD